MKKVDAFIALCLIALGGGAYYTASTEYAEGTEVAPMIYAAGLIALSLVLLISSLLRKSAESKEPGLKTGRLLGVLGFIAAYIALIYYAGFYVATEAFLVLFMIVMKATTPVKSVVISTVITALLYLFFCRVLLVPTPAGMIGLI